MLDVACLICGKMKGDEIYNESIKQNLVWWQSLVTVMWLKMKITSWSPWAKYSALQTKTKLKCLWFFLVTGSNWNVPHDVKINYANTLIRKEQTPHFIFTHQWTRQPSPFTRDSWINMILSLKYQVEWEAVILYAFWSLPSPLVCEHIFLWMCKVCWASQKTLSLKRLISRLVFTSAT